MPTAKHNAKRIFVDCHTLCNMMPGGSDFALIFWYNLDRTLFYFDATACNMLHSVC